LFELYDPPVSPGEDFFHLLFIAQEFTVRSSEYPFPPGEQFSGEKSEKVDSGDASHIGPENGFSKTEFKLNDDQGKGRRELKGTKEYGKYYLYQNALVIS
jgi:hypothetical protein